MSFYEVKLTEEEHIIFIELSRLQKKYPAFNFMAVKQGTSIDDVLHGDKLIKV